MTIQCISVYETVTHCTYGYTKNFKNNLGKESDTQNELCVLPRNSSEHLKKIYIYNFLKSWNIGKCKGKYSCSRGSTIWSKRSFLCII